MENEKYMITLYTFGPAYGLQDASPFVVKAMLLLKMAQLPYTTDSRSFSRAPKGKLPYIQDGTEIIADSTFIRWHIEEKYGVDFERTLSAKERGTAWALEKLLEDNLYWIIVDNRWLDDKNFARGPATLFDKMPWPMRVVVKRMVRRQIAKSLKAQGMGRHARPEMLAIATKGLASVAEILGDQPYLMGSSPCGADATAFAFIASALCPHFDTPLRVAVQMHPNLVAYVARLQAQYFPTP